MIEKIRKNVLNGEVLLCVLTIGLRAVLENIAGSREDDIGCRDGIQSFVRRAI